MELNDRLAEVAAERDRLQRQARLLAETRSQLATEQSRLRDLERQLHQEEQDVASLQGASLGSLFHSILGDRETRLERERQEALRARLRFDEARSAVRRLQSDLLSLQGQVERLPELEAEYADLLRQKQATLGGAGGQPEELRQLEERLNVLRREQRELQEAIAAGEEVQASLAQVSKALNSAAGWGVWDMMGGGLLATMAKHSSMDTAREHAHRAEQALRRFHRELQDVAVQLSLSVEMDGFIRFADYFFDGLIVDWTVQNRINRSREAVSQAEQQVNSTLATLLTRRDSNEQQAAAAAREREDLLQRL